MGKFDGKHLTGVIGNAIVRKGRNVQIIQSKPIQVKQTQETKKSANLFGKASTLSKYMRKLVGHTYGSNNDTGMINRLTTLNRVLLAHCLQPETQTFNFETDSFSKLAGFEFNTKSPLANSLWVQPEINLLNQTLQINLPALEIPAQLNFHNDAKACDLELEVAVLSLQPGYNKASYHATVEIAKSQQMLPAQSWEVELPLGCLAVVAIGLKYFTLHNNIKTPLNSGKFHPAGIVAAIFNPGNFLVPKPVKLPHRAQGTGWTELTDLKL